MEKLSLIVITAGDKNILLPSALVEQVFPFAPPLLVDEKSAFIVGAFLYQYEKLPVIDFFSRGDDAHQVMGGSRMILMSSVTSSSGYPHYTVLSSEDPVSIEVEEDQLIEIAESGELPDFMRMKVLVDKSIAEGIGGKPAYIPDLIKLEQEMFMI